MSIFKLSPRTEFVNDSETMIYFFISQVLLVRLISIYTSGSIAIPDIKCFKACPLIFLFVNSYRSLSESSATFDNANPNNDKVHIEVCVYFELYISRIINTHSIEPN